MVYSILLELLEAVFFNISVVGLGVVVFECLISSGMGGFLQNWPLLQVFIY